MIVTFTNTLSLKCRSFLFAVEGLHHTSSCEYVSYLPIRSENIVSYWTAAQTILIIGQKVAMI